MWSFNIKRTGAGESSNCLPAKLADTFWIYLPEKKVYSFAQRWTFLPKNLANRFGFYPPASNFTLFGGWQAYFAIPASKLLLVVLKDTMWIFRRRLASSKHHIWTFQSKVKHIMLHTLQIFCDNDIFRWPVALWTTYLQHLS